MTKISHGETEIGDGLIMAMSRQLKLSKSQFQDLVNCPKKSTYKFSENAVRLNCKPVKAGSEHGGWQTRHLFFRSNFHSVMDNMYSALFGNHYMNDLRLLISQ